MFLEQIEVIVDSYDEAIEFFVEKLGFELVEDSRATTNDGRPKRWVVVRPPEANTALLLAQADGDRRHRAVGDQFAGRLASSCVSSISTPHMSGCAPAASSS